MEKSHCQNKLRKEHGDVTTGKLQHKNCTTSTGTYYRFYELQFVNKEIVEGTDLRSIQVFIHAFRVLVHHESREDFIGTGSVGVK